MNACERSEQLEVVKPTFGIPPTPFPGAPVFSCFVRLFAANVFGGCVAVSIDC